MKINLITRDMRSFNVEIIPLRENDSPLIVKLVPDAVKEFIAGYSIYLDNIKVGYVRKLEYDHLIETKQYRVL
jgi:hypothetical protein